MVQNGLLFQMVQNVQTERTIQYREYPTKQSARTYLLCAHISVMIAPADCSAGNIPTI